MKLYLYEVRFTGGTSNKNWRRFFENVTDMGAVSTDRAGILGLCAISSFRDADGVKELCTRNFRPKSAIAYVTVEEITAATVGNSNHAHSAYQNVVDRFRPYGTYPNL